MASRRDTRTNPKIRFLWDSVVTQVTGDTKVTGLRVRNVKTGGEHAIDIGGLFEAFGHEPRSELFTGQLDTDPEGYVLLGPPSTRTTLAGVFVCGDVVDRSYRQAVTAAGTGAAAIDAWCWLAAQEPWATGSPARTNNAGADADPGRMASQQGRGLCWPAHPGVVRHRRTARHGRSGISRMRACGRAEQVTPR